MRAPGGWTWRGASPNLATRLASVFRLPPAEAVAVLDYLIEETMAPVEGHMPQVDVSGVRADFEATRPTWDAPPP